jgi:hypothetical protein
MPPTATICCEYALPVRPAGRGEVEEMTSGVRVIVRENAWEMTFAALSVTVTVKLAVPTAVALPEISPVEDMVSPDCKEPRVIAKV